MVENNLLVHPRQRLPHRAVPLLDTRPEVNFQRGRFFIYEDEFEFRVSSLCSPFSKIKALLSLYETIIRKLLIKV